MTRGVKLPAGTTLQVALRWDAQTLVPVGRLGMRQRQVLFQFEPQFLVDGVEISPLKLRRQPGVLSAVEPAFEHLPGVFSDSLPDGWGRLLLDRAARREGVAPATLTPLDRLAHVGSDGIGALVYRPELASDAEGMAVDLDELALASRAVLAGHSDELLDQLRAIGGSPQGARPKALVQIHRTTGALTDALRDRGPDWRHWLVKFAGPSDVVDIGPLELAYARMAVAAGIQMPEVQLLPSRSGPGYFAVARFDRQNDQRLHVATAAGLLHADYRLPSLDYLDLIKLTTHLTKDHQQSEALFRRMVFNVLAHNRDDHAKQFSFCMGRNGVWQLGPAYDLTFADGPGGEHSTSIAGVGRAPGKDQLLQVAAAAGLKPHKAANIVEQTRAVLARWPVYAHEAGVSTATTQWVGKALGELGKGFGGA